jgi:hypothetical protein
MYHQVRPSSPKLQAQGYVHANSLKDVYVDRRDLSFIPFFGHTDGIPFSECLQTGPKAKVRSVHVFQ